eukprot:PhF_6_TR3348/c0_g1_i5/m.4739
MTSPMVGFATLVFALYVRMASIIGPYSRFTTEATSTLSSFLNPASSAPLKARSTPLKLAVPLALSRMRMQQIRIVERRRLVRELPRLPHVLDHLHNLHPTLTTLPPKGFHRCESFVRPRHHRPYRVPRVLQKL